MMDTPLNPHFLAETPNNCHTIINSLQKDGRKERRRGRGGDTNHLPSPKKPTTCPKWYL